MQILRRREFPTHFKALLDLKMWLLAQKVTHVTMESTGVYRKPVWQALEGSFQLILANPFQVRTFPAERPMPATANGWPSCWRMA